jgi:protein-S-isoprenylcysteine O-methyltransferase Ste14
MLKRLPPKLLLLSILASAVLHYTFPVAQIINFPFTFIGILFVGVGWGLSLWSERVIDAHGTALHCQKKPTALVTVGPFAFSRNPFYLGYFVITIGAAVMLGSLASFIGPLFFFIAINAWVIPGEEKRLQEIFVGDYVEYRNKVRRWI